MFGLVCMRQSDLTPLALKVKNCSQGLLESLEFAKQ